MIAAVEGAQMDGACLRLAGCNAIRYGLNTMVQRVAEQVNERVADFIDNRPV
ncbi:hypothetical protein D3C73_1660700 [compost metagenome]